MKVTLRNSFHNTQAQVIVPELPASLSRHQVRRVRRALCGVQGCECGGDLGERGPQTVTVEVAPRIYPDGYEITLSEGLPHVYDTTVTVFFRGSTPLATLVHVPMPRGARFPVRYYEGGRLSLLSSFDLGYTLGIRLRRMGDEHYHGFGKKVEARTIHARSSLNLLRAFQPGWRKVAGEWTKRGDEDGH